MAAHEHVSIPDAVSIPENISRIAEYLRDGKKVLVIAPRRMGKTTLAQEVHKIVNASMVLVLYPNDKKEWGEPAHTYEEVQDTTEDHDTKGKILILEEPWLAKDAWRYMHQDGGRLFIGTPRSTDKTPEESTFDVVEHLGFGKAE